MNPTVTQSINMNLTNQDLFDLMHQSELERVEKEILEIEKKRSELKKNINELYAKHDEKIRQQLKDFFFKKYKSTHLKGVNPDDVQLKIIARKSDNRSIMYIRHENPYTDLSLAVLSTRDKSWFNDSDHYTSYHYVHRIEPSPVIYDCTLSILKEVNPKVVFTTEIKETDIRVSAKKLDDELYNKIKALIDFDELYDKHYYLMQQWITLKHEPKKLKAIFLKGSLKQSAEGKALLEMISKISQTKLLEL